MWAGGVWPVCGLCESPGDSVFSGGRTIWGRLLCFSVGLASGAERVLVRAFWASSGSRAVRVSAWQAGGGEF